MSATHVRIAAARGFTLIEVLIALLVLSIGLLGLAGLQATTVQLNQAAYLRSQATNLAYMMADRMRANRAAALNGGAYDAVVFTDPPPACAPPGGATVAERDIAAWRTALACTLPLGNGQIRRTNGNLVTISVRWDDSRGEDAPELFEMTTGI